MMMPDTAWPFARSMQARLQSSEFFLTVIGSWLVLLVMAPLKLAFRLWSLFHVQGTGIIEVIKGVVKGSCQETRKFRYSDYNVVAAESEQGCDKFPRPLTYPKSGLCESSCPQASKLSDLQNGAKCAHTATVTTQTVYGSLTPRRCPSSSTPTPTPPLPS